jgi:AGCS family alanine or glycine:cation symporter
MDGTLGGVSIHQVETAPQRGDVVADAPMLTGEARVREGELQGAALAVNDGFILEAEILDGSGSPFTGTIRAEAGSIAEGPPGLKFRGECMQNSSALTQWAFETELGVFGRWVVTLSVFLFALSTTISWSYYGDRCAEYLFGIESVAVYRWMYVGFVFLGAVLALEVVWAYGDLALGLMSAPNLIAIFILGNRVKRSTDKYFATEHPVYK